MRLNHYRTLLGSRLISTTDFEIDSSKIEEIYDLIKEIGVITLLLKDLYDRTNKLILKAITD